MREFLFRGTGIPHGIPCERADFAGYTFTCATCGEQWGKLDFGKANNRRWVNFTWPCENHGSEPGYQRGGSILWQLKHDHGLHGALKIVSYELLVHEVLMIYNQREQFALKG